jgi:hypothetical protein
MTETQLCHGGRARQVIRAEFNSRNDAEAAIEQLWAGEAR